MGGLATIQKKAVSEIQNEMKPAWNCPSVRRYSASISGSRAGGESFKEVGECHMFNDLPGRSQCEGRMQLITSKYAKQRMIKKKNSTCSNWYLNSFSTSHFCWKALKKTSPKIRVIQHDCLCNGIDHKMLYVVNNWLDFSSQKSSKK